MMKSAVNFDRTFFCITMKDKKKGVC